MATLHSPSVITGGVEKHTFQLARSLSELGHDVTLFYANPGSNASPESIEGTTMYPIRIPLYDILPVDKKRLVLPYFDSAVQRIAGTEDFDVLHSQNLDGVPNTRQSTSIKTVVTIHTAPYRRLMKARRTGSVGNVLATTVEHVKCRRFRACAYVCVSDLVKMDLRRVYGKECVVIPTGASEPKPIEREKARRAIGIDQWGKTILFLSRVTREKGAHKLLDFIEATPDTGLLVGGTGEFLDTLVKMVEHRGLTGRVRILGFIDTEFLGTVFSAADCFALPSDQVEGSPAVLLEALSYGLPCYVSDVGLVPENLRSSVVSGGLAEGILTALSMGRQPTRTVTWQYVARETANVYERVIQR